MNNTDRTLATILFTGNVAKRSPKSMVCSITNVCVHMCVTQEDLPLQTVAGLELGDKTQFEAVTQAEN